MLFWIPALALCAAIAAALLFALARGGRKAAGNADIRVYRDQLAEIDRDLARGVIDKAEAERARIEISRRILEADRAGGADGSAQGSPVLPAVAVGAAIMAAVPLYWYFGAPGYPDLPIADRLARAEAFHADRPSQAEAVAQTTLPERPEPDPAYAELMDRLRAAVTANPDDITGQRLLARNEAALGNFTAAAEAQARVIGLAGDGATATDYAVLADNYVLATNGYVSPEAEAALAEALRRDATHPTARYYMGQMWAQTGRPDRAFQIWRRLLEEGPEEAPWIVPIRARIAVLARAAGVEYAPPAPPSAEPGPDAADIAAASAMTAEERMEMIRGMVDGLSERLSTDGGPAGDWARLISSLGVLGERDRAKAIWDEAQAVFAGREAELDEVRRAAEQAGVAE